MTTRVSSHPCFFCQELTSLAPNPLLGAPVCQYCLLKRHAYDCANEHTTGSADGLPQFSVEFEVCSCSSSSEAGQSAREYALLLTRHGFLKTHDDTVEDEYKSPRYLGIDALIHVLPLMDHLKEAVDGCCGTHIHVDCRTRRLVNHHRRTLFGPLDAYIQANGEEAEQFWGRRAEQLVNANTRYETIEFRRPRFRSASQYLRVVQFCRAVGSYLTLHLDPWYPAADLLDPKDIGQDILTFYLQATAHLRPPATGMLSTSSEATPLPLSNAS